MPRGDGTGPDGDGPRGRGAGAGRGRMGKYSAGPGGECVCPECGKRVPHERGVPCADLKCPDCGRNMTRAVE